MHIDVLDEPELEFGGAQRHVDPRFGIAAYGPADLGHDGAPTAIRLGLVGPVTSSTASGGGSTGAAARSTPRTTSTRTCSPDSPAATATPGCAPP